jgi:hypothetical protein
MQVMRVCKSMGSTSAAPADVKSMIKVKIATKTQKAALFCRSTLTLGL